MNRDTGIASSLFEGETCPLCGCGGQSHDRAYTPSGAGNQLQQAAKCHRCGATWTEHFRLSGYSNLQQGGNVIAIDLDPK